MSIRLITYEAARVALKQAIEIDDVKDIRDKAQAIEAYARQAKNDDMIRWATEIKLRAERRAGELLTETQRAKGGNPNLTHTLRAWVGNPTLAEVGITPKQSSSFQAIAAIPEKEFEEAVSTGKETTASLVRKSPKKAKALAEAKEKKPKKPKAAKPLPDGAEEKELANALESADQEIRGLQALVESLQASDLAKELTKLHERYAKLEGRLQLAITQKNEAEKQARYSTGLLAKIRKALKIQKNAEILEAIRQ